MNFIRNFHNSNTHLRVPLAFIIVTLISFPVLAQSTTGAVTLRGTVTLGDSGKPVHNVLITILQLKRTVDTDDDGKYEFQECRRVNTTSSRILIAFPI